MSKSLRFLIISVVVAAALLLVLGAAFAAPGGTVIITPPSATKTGLPGQTVTHTLWITNSGGTAGITDTFTLELGTHVWVATLPVTQVKLVGGAGMSFNVLVTIPVTPTATSDSVDVAVSDASTVQFTAHLTTRFYRIYLPIVRRS